MRISDWSSDVCSSDLAARIGALDRGVPAAAAISPSQATFMRQALVAGPVSTSSSFQPIQRSRRGRSLDAPHPTDHENGQGHPTPTFGTVPATFGENGTETPRDAPGSHGQSQDRKSTRLNSSH